MWQKVDSIDDIYCFKVYGSWGWIITHSGWNWEKIFQENCLGSIMLQLFSDQHHVSQGHLHLWQVDCHLHHSDQDHHCPRWGVQIHCVTWVEQVGDQNHLLRMFAMQHQSARKQGTGRDIESEHPSDERSKPSRHNDPVRLVQMG